MKSKEKRNFVLGSLILVLAISIGYFGISNAGDTYATSTGACYFCTGKSDYVWSDGGGIPSETCNGGIWQKQIELKLIVGINVILVQDSLLLNGLLELHQRLVMVEFGVL